MKNLLIIEDNIRNMERLIEIVKKMNKDFKIYHANTLECAYGIALTYDIDIFLIDIALNNQNPNDASGIELALKLRKVSSYRFTPMLFITRIEDFQLIAYRDIHCYSYIEKPYSDDMIIDAINELIEFPDTRKIQKRDFIFKKDGLLFRFSQENIVYIDNSNRELKIVTVEESTTASYMTLNKTLERLDKEKFVQCNRSCIVNKNYIRSIDYKKCLIELKNGYGNLEIGSIIKKRFRDEME